MLVGDELENQQIKKNVLIVDDEPLNVFLLQQILKSYDLTITTATDGQQAVEKFTNNKTDLILMDVYMPVMDGIEASKQIKNISLSTPIIIISAAMLNVDNLKKETNIDYFLPKPVNIEKLKDLINKLLFAE
eukprot:Opistho-1_new@1069